MPQEIKEQERKEFDEWYEKQKEINPYMIRDYWLNKTDSLIDRTQKETEKRIVEGVKDLTPFGIGVPQDPLVSKDSVISLITNKSDINKDKK